MFTQYKFSPLQVSDAAQAAARTLAAAQPGMAPAAFAARTIADRLRANPAAFLQYGPYWWAVKRALRDLGEDFGAADDALIRAEYAGTFYPYDALVAGEQFREFYLATFLAGTSQFWLDMDAEESYVLFDQDMEVRRMGGASPLRIAADLQQLTVDVSADEWVLDSAARAELRPFPVKFEHEATLWTAHVYALDSAAAEEKVRGLEKSGRLLRAIEHSKTVGDASLDSTGDEPLYVDRAVRRVCEMAPTGQLAGGLPGRAAA